MKTAVLQFAPDGSARGLWTEAIDLAQLGDLKVKRASRIEFNNARSLWEVTIDGCRVPSFEASSRQACLDWEHQELTNALLKGRI